MSGYIIPFPLFSGNLFFSGPAQGAFCSPRNPDTLCGDIPLAGPLVDHTGKAACPACLCGSPGPRRSKPVRRAMGEEVFRTKKTPRDSWEFRGIHRAKTLMRVSGLLRSRFFALPRARLGHPYGARGFSAFLRYFFDLVQVQAADIGNLLHRLGSRQQPLDQADPGVVFSFRPALGPAFFLALSQRGKPHIL